MKLFKKIIIITFLLIIYAYVCNISLLPSNYIIMQGENLRLYTLLGIRLRRKQLSDIANFKYTRTGKNK